MRRILRAAFTSRSWTLPQSSQRHSLIRKPAIPLGLEAGRPPHSEQVWVVLASQTSRNTPPRVIALYASMPLRLAQPASSTLFAIRERAILAAPTSPTTMVPNCFVSRWLTLCRKSLRRFATLRWMLRARFAFPARWAVASRSSEARTSRGARIFSPVESAARSFRPRSTLTAGIGIETARLKRRVRRDIAQMHRLVMLAPEHQPVAVERYVSGVERNPAERFPAAPAQPWATMSCARGSVLAAHPLDGVGMDVEHLPGAGRQGCQLTVAKPAPPILGSLLLGLVAVIPHGVDRARLPSQFDRVPISQAQLVSSQGAHLDVRRVTRLSGTKQEHAYLSPEGRGLRAAISIIDLRLHKSDA